MYSYVLHAGLLRFRCKLRRESHLGFRWCRTGHWIRRGLYILEEIDSFGDAQNLTDI